jgi:hypothetical protein
MGRAAEKLGGGGAHDALEVVGWRGGVREQAGTELPSSELIVGDY